MPKLSYRISLDSHYPDEVCIDSRPWDNSLPWKFVNFAKSIEEAEKTILLQMERDRMPRITTIKEFPYVES